MLVLTEPRKMPLSQPVDWLKKDFVGYVLNTEFSEQNAALLMSVIESINEHFGNAVFCMPKKSLHITLLDWIAPLVDYQQQNKDQLFAQVQPAYNKVMQEVMAQVGTIDVHFNTIAFSPSTIYITGTDNGQFQQIRQSFVQGVDLLPGTKMPPQIIHSSLARFTNPINLNRVEQFLATQKIDFIQHVTNFRLMRTTKEPTLEFEVLKRYELART